MSSPSINVGQATTSLETICNLVRALVNDSQAGVTNTPGEGQIFTDNPRFLLRFADAEFSPYENYIAC